ncbi:MULTISPECIES: glycosyl hydrolase family 8 [unclassified Coleofasciculus]|uniref:glycosyl hydrolase family 8 n=1 Tax=unclassified Coleofasciculus TaxID=2692782 RepID=UPI001D147364|nr:MULTISPECIES: glycosyl hydrolase family 8 [unclassified Coleofasciculus]
MGTVLIDQFEKMLILVVFLKFRDLAPRLQPVLKAVAVVVVVSNLTGCVSISFTEEPETPLSPSPTTTVSPVVSSPSLPTGTANQDILEQSWVIYKQQFIQEDGRVIDYEASDRSTSEGQAYAMLRAVLIDDPTIFALTLDWAEKNLHRLSATGEPVDQLWVWLWGKDKSGNWGSIDSNFASDADIDAITALIWASRRWNRPDYLELAQLKLQDLWELSTVAGPKGERYLLPGPKAAFAPSASTIYLNPSYFAPYAFRLFAQVDPKHDWLSLVDSSYQVLEKSSQVSTVGLPSDWIALNPQTGQFQPMPSTHKLQSVYSFDAYRVWWRVAWDADLFGAPAAQRYLNESTKLLQTQWRSSSRLPARIDLQGKSLVNYEATSQYAMLYLALRSVNPDMAQQLLKQKLLPRYNQGIWDDESAYYTQNLAWLGLLPTTVINPQLLKP